MLHAHVPAKRGPDRAPRKRTRIHKEDKDGG